MLPALALELGTAAINQRWPRGTYMKRHATRLAQRVLDRPSDSREALASHMREYFTAMVVYRNAEAIIDVVRTAVGQVGLRAGR